MKPFSIIIVAFAFTSFGIACKKNVSTSPVPINDTLIDTVDFREQYKGVFEVRIYSEGWTTGVFRNDTTYKTFLRVDYKKEDSMVWTYDHAPLGSVKLYYVPEITFYYPDDKVYYKLGIDKKGKIYKDLGSKVPVSFGGFVSKDSMDFVFGYISNHSGRLDTVRGHRIQ